MSSSFAAVDRQVKASEGNYRQAELGLIGAVSDYQLLPMSVVSQATFNGCLSEAARHSGLEDQQIAEEIHICAGYMSRFMRGVAQQWARRLISYMRTTRSYAPLQWICHQMGGEFVPGDSAAARIRALEDEIKTIRRQG